MTELLKTFLEKYKVSQYAEALAAEDVGCNEETFPIIIQLEPFQIENILKVAKLPAVHQQFFMKGIMDIKKSLATLGKRKASEAFATELEYLRCFAVANAAYPFLHFYVKPNIIDDMGISIARGGYTLLCGHRQSGKSTICQALFRWFKENPKRLPPITPEYFPDLDLDQDEEHSYEIYIVTFDSTIDVTHGIDKLWESICQKFASINEQRFPWLSGSLLSAKAAFQNFFSKNNLRNRSYTPKPVILLIDEASRLTGKITDESQILINDFLSILRGIKDDRTNSCLHSVALFGTETALDLIVHEKQDPTTGIITTSISPFSKEKTMRTDRFSQENVLELFFQFALVKTRKFDYLKIALDVFALTGGHKGLVGACGGFIQNSYDCDRIPIYTADDWEMNTVINLQTHIRALDTYYSIIRSLPSLTNGQRIILGNVLRFGEYMLAPEDPNLRPLLAEGLVLVETTCDRFLKIICAAPILRSLMLSEIKSPPIDIEDCPDDLNPRWLLLHTIEYLCVQHLYANQTMNSSTGEPSEYSFQAEFATIIKALLLKAYPLKGYKTLVEVKERNDDNDRRQRLDILIRNGPLTPAYGFELVVAPTLERFQEHVTRAKHYATVHKTKSMFMVNLCPKTNVDYFKKVTPPERKSDRIVAIANKPQYAEKPPEPFTFSEDVTPVNVIINAVDDGKWTATLDYYDGDNDFIEIKGSEWSMLF